MADICPMKKQDVLFNFENGLKAEERAIALCRELIGLMDDHEDKKKLERIIADEVRHIAITRELIEITNAHYDENGSFGK
jgi:rubrerythrin